MFCIRGRSQREDGNGPERLLLYRNRLWSDVALERASGMGPEKRFPWRLRRRRYSRVPSSEGM